MSDTKLGFQVLPRGTQEKNIVLRIGFSLLCLVCMAQLVIIIALVNRPLKAMVVSGRVSPGVYTAGEYTEDFVKVFATDFLERYQNVTAQTVDVAYNTKDADAFLVNYLAPEFLSQTKAVLEKDKETVKQDSLVLLFKTTSVPQLEKDKDGYYTATVTGRKEVWMGSVFTQEKDIQFKLWIREATPNKNNPFGLVVAGMKRTIVKDYK